MAVQDGAVRLKDANSNYLILTTLWACLRLRTPCIISNGTKPLVLSQVRIGEWYQEEITILRLNGSRLGTLKEFACKGVHSLATK